MWAIFKREVKSFFLTPIGYVYMGIFLLLSGIFFVFLLLDQVSDYTGRTLGLMSYTLLFATPLLTMKLISEERKSGTDQLLLTSPVGLTGVIIGKYLAALFVFVCSLLVTLIYPAILSNLASLDWSVIALGYLGCFLLGAAFISIGLFASSITENQVVAAIVSFCLLLLLWIMQFFESILPLNEGGQTILRWFFLQNRYIDFEAGQLNVSSILFFVSIIMVFLFLTYRSIEKRRWSKG